MKESGLSSGHRRHTWCFGGFGFTRDSIPKAMVWDRGCSWKFGRICDFECLRYLLFSRTLHVDYNETQTLLISESRA